jgi:hypothetical protein
MIVKIFNSEYLNKVLDMLWEGVVIEILNDL